MKTNIKYILILLTNQLYGQQLDAKQIELDFSNGHAIFFVSKNESKLPTVDYDKTYYWYTEKTGLQNTQGSYSGHLLNGQFQFFNDEGRLVDQKNYKQGLLDGESIEWDDNGLMLIRITYKGGECYKSTHYDLEGIYGANSNPDDDSDLYVQWEYKKIDINQFKSSNKFELLLNTIESATSTCLCVGLPGCIKTTYSKKSKLPVMKIEWLTLDTSKETWFYDYSTQPSTISLFNWKEGEFGEYEQFHKNGLIKAKGRLYLDKLDGEMTIYDEKGTATGIMLYQNGEVTKIIK